MRLFEAHSMYLILQKNILLGSQALNMEYTYMGMFIAGL